MGFWIMSTALSMTISTRCSNALNSCMSASAVKVFRIFCKLFEDPDNELHILVTEQFVHLCANSSTALDVGAKTSLKSRGTVQAG